MYTKVTYDLGEVREIQKYIPGNYGAPGCPRERKRKRTPEEIKRQNERNKRRKVQRLIMANFSEGDLHVILTYTKDRRPETAEKANALRAKFLAELRKKFHKAEADLKYIGVTEIGSRGAVHHHIVINNPEGVDVMKLIQKAWTYGHPYFSPLYEEGEYEQLADYLLKGGHNYETVPDTLIEIYETCPLEKRQRFIKLMQDLLSMILSSSEEEK